MLAPVLSVVSAADQAAVDAILGPVPTIEGFDKLDEAQQTVVKEALQQAVAKAVEIKRKAEAAAAAPGPATAAAGGVGGGSGSSSKDEKEGRLTGKVAWKWGAHTCYGKLIKSRETKTHCYATTHKGNVKTLAKGKDYWWQV